MLKNYLRRRQWNSRITRSMLLLVVMVLSVQASATHFRYGNMSWKRDLSYTGAGYKIDFTITEAWRRGFAWTTYGSQNFGSNGLPDPGEQIQFYSNFPIVWGDATANQNVTLAVTSVIPTSAIPAEDIVNGVFNVSHIYQSTAAIPVPTSYIAYFEGAARLNAGTGPTFLQNNGGGSFRVESKITVGNNNDAPVSGLPPVVNMVVNTNPATFQIPATDPNGDVITYSLAPSASFTQTGQAPNTQPFQTVPGVFSVSSTGLISFNTTGLTVGAQYNTVIRLTDSRGGYVNLDIIIRISNSSSAPVFDYSAGMTPADLTTYTIPIGQNLSFNVKATDPDAADAVTLFGVGIPVGATLTPSLPLTGPVNGAATTTFSWTPTAAQKGSYSTTFTAQDPQGVQTSTTVNIIVTCAVDFTYVAVSATCSANNGSITVNTSGGSAPFTYSDDGGTSFGPSNTFAGLAPGTYSVQVKESNGCVVEHVVNIGNAPDNTLPNLVSYSTPASPVTITQLGRSSTYSSTKLNGGTNSLVVNPGASVNLTSSWTSAYAGGGGCPGCITQHYIGLNGIFSDCHDAGFGSGSINRTFNAPSAPGVYYITQNAEWWYFCNQFGTPPNSNSPDEAIAVLIVRGTNSCQADITQNVDPNTCGAAVTYNTPVGIDNCPGVTVAQTAGQASGTVFPIGTTTNTFVATDASSNTTSCSFNVVVVDNQAPAITCPANITQACTASTAASNTGTATASDNCTAAPAISFTDVVTNGSCAGNYTIARTWKATDAANNSSTCTQTITVQDLTAPVIACPANVTQACSASTAPTNTGMATATDNCSGATITYTDATVTGSCAGNYVITRTWKAMDACGNSSTCNQTITVQDNTAPVITCLPLSFVSCSADHSPTSTGTPTVTDNCSGVATLTYTDFIATGACAGSYMILRSWRAVDNCGNISGCVQFIEVDDYAPPVIACPTNKTIACTASTLPVNTGTATATDGCSGATVTYTDVTTAGNCPGNYSIARTWKATDGCGNFSTCTQTITVQDQTAPVIVCPASKTIACTDNSLPTATGTGVAMATDDCSGVTSIISTDVITAGSCAGNYSIARTWTATDACGNSSSCVQTISVQDLTAPVVTCPSNKTIDCAASTLPANTGTATATDNCSGTTVTYTDAITAGNCAGNYSIARTWKATDGCGNFSTCTQTITVQDLTAPVIACPTSKTIACTASTDPSNTGLATATDNCSGAAVTYTDIRTNGNCAGNYSIARTWKATDGCGNFSTCVQTITVQDLTAPVIACPTNKTIACTASTLPANTGTATATDGCSGATVTYTDVTTAGNCPGNYSIARTWKATDGCGNFSTCTQTITVQDQTAPVIVCPASKTIACTDNSLPTATGTGVAMATDDCSGVTSIISTDVITAGSCAGNYSIARTWTATDACGNSSSCVQTISVQDLTAPVVTCPSNKTIDCAASTLPANTGTATATDNCSGTTVTYTDIRTNGACASSYSIARTWKATDGCGNFSTCTQTITVQDNTPPVVTCPNTVFASCSGDRSPAITGTATATDNCSGVASLNYYDYTAAGSCAGNYLVIRVWVAIDNCGNIGSCNQNILVQDLTAPAIACPTNKTIACGASTSPSNTGTATATDGCSGATLTYTDATTAGSCAGNYVITRTWKATDGCGNFSTCTQTITVQDLTAPVITCPASVTIACTASTLPASTGMATATDGCSGATLTYTDATTAGSCAGRYVITRTWKATDGCGNSSTCAQTITVQDNTAPVVTCPANKTVDCAASTLPANTGTATATDGCSGATVTYTDIRANGACTGSYSIARTWKATDGCGNFSTCTQTITVQDNTAPTAMCKNVTVTLVNGAATVTAAQVDNGSFDNCSGVASLTLSKTSFTCANIGSNAVTLTVKDGCGNTSTCTATVTVTGAAPSCSLSVTPSSTTYTGGVPTNIYIGYGPQSATINVGATGGSGFTYSWSPTTKLSCATCSNPVFTPTAAGNYTYTVTAKNSYGCTTTCSVTFCVKDIRERDDDDCDNDDYTGKVWICHVSGSSSSSMAVSASQAASHLASHSNDRLGKCSQICGTAARMAGNYDNILGNDVKVYPNPNNGTFTIELPYVEDKAFINVIDVSGKTILSRVVTDADGNKLNMQLGDVPRGIYLVEVTNGDQRFRTRLVVQ